MYLQKLILSHRQSALKYFDMILVVHMHHDMTKPWGELWNKAGCRWCNHWKLVVMVHIIACGFSKPFDFLQMDYASNFPAHFIMIAQAW